MKNAVLVALLACLSNSAFAYTYLAQNQYRWRNDDGDEATASWKAPQNEHADITDLSVLRLRIEVVRYELEDFGDGSATYGSLFYSDNGGTSWTEITHDTANAFVYATSPYVADGMATTNQMTGTDTVHVFSPGMIFSDTLNYFGGIVGKSEYEWIIRPTTNVSSLTYQFEIKAPDGPYGDFSIHNVALLNVDLISTGLSEIANARGILSAYPNPVENEVTVRYKGSVCGKGTLLLTDASGRTVGRGRIESNGTAKLPMARLPKGMYILKYQDDKTVYSVKVNKM